MPHQRFQRFDYCIVLVLHLDMILTLYHTISTFNPLPSKPWFLRVCSRSLLKTLWEKEKLLVMSNFSFSHTVFYPFGGLSTIFIKYDIVVCKLFQFGRVEKLSFGKGLTTLVMKPFENTVIKKGRNCT